MTTGNAFLTCQFVYCLEYVLELQNLQKIIKLVTDICWLLLILWKRKYMLCFPQLGVFTHSIRRILLSLDTLAQYNRRGIPLQHLGRTYQCSYLNKPLALIKSKRSRHDIRSWFLVYVLTFFPGSARSRKLCTYLNYNCPWQWTTKFNVLKFNNFVIFTLKFSLYKILWLSFRNWGTRFLELEQKGFQ